MRICSVNVTQARADLNNVISGLNAELRNDPAGHILIMQEIPAKALPGDGLPLSPAHLAIRN